MSEKNNVEEKDFYANSFLINISPLDVEIQGQLVNSRQEIKESISIRISLQTAWALSKSLDKQLKEYEVEYGEINIPKVIKDQINIET